MCSYLTSNILLLSPTAEIQREGVHYDSSGFLVFFSLTSFWYAELPIFDEKKAEFMVLWKVNDIARVVLRGSVSSVAVAVFVRIV